MRVDVHATVLNIPESAQLQSRTAVVIDVLRATTTITAALAAGASCVVPLLTPEDAFAMVRAQPGRRFILGGERNSVRIDSFHLGNSPLEYTRERVEGLLLLFTTTNGTRALRRAAPAAELYVACLNNAPAVARRLLAAGRDVALCCAGTKEQFSLEDTLCAGAVLAHMEGQGEALTTCDLGRVALALYREHQGNLLELLTLSEHGQSLLRLGLAEDLAYCAKLGQTELVARLEEGALVV